MAQPRVWLPGWLVAILLLPGCETVSSDERIGESRRLTEQGLTLLEQDDRRGAAALFEQARILAVREHNPSDEGRALNGLGLCLETDGQLELAIESYGRAESRYQEASDADDAFVTLMNRAQCLARMHREQESIALVEQALHDADDLSYWHQAIGHQTLGLVHHQVKDYDAAYRELVEARALFELAHDRAGEALTFLLTAQLLERSMNYKEALHRFSLAKKRYSRLADPDCTAACTVGIARCYQKLKQPENAVILLRKARADQTQMSAGTRREILLTLAQLYEEQGSTEEAASCRSELAGIADDPGATISPARRRRQSPPTAPPRAQKAKPADAWDEAPEPDRR